MDHPIGVKELPFLLLKYKLPLWRVDGQMPASRSLPFPSRCTLAFPVHGPLDAQPLPPYYIGVPAGGPTRFFSYVYYELDNLLFSHSRTDTFD